MTFLISAVFTPTSYLPLSQEILASEPMNISISSNLQASLPPRYDRGDVSFIIVAGAMVAFMVPGLGSYNPMPRIQRISIDPPS